MTIRKKTNYHIVECKNEQDWLTSRKLYLTASDTASAIGKSKWKSPLELWGEKTELRQPKDLSNNAFVLRGKEREPIIRDTFTRKHPYFNVDYHQYNIYVSNIEGYGMLGATLDGELTVIAENPFNLPIGSRGVLEIKTVTADRISSSVEAWLNGEIPEHYIPQVHQQIFCFDADFAIAQAEFDYGEEAEERYIMMPPVLVEADKELFAIQQTVREARDFWNFVETKTPPNTVIEAETEEGLEIVPIMADTEVGSFYQNFDLVKASVERIVEPYRGIEFSESQLKEAKEIRADLNKMVKEIDSKRLAVKKKYLEPLNYFESKANELKEVITAVINPISEQIDEFENNRIAEKQELIEGMASSMVLELMDEEIGNFFCRCGGVDFDKKWLNKTVKEDAIKTAIKAQIDSFKQSYESIVSFASGDKELLSMMLSEFGRTKNISDALKAKERIEASREMARKAQEEAKRQADELLARMKEKEAQKEAKTEAKKPYVMPTERPSEAIASEPIAEPQSDSKPRSVYTFTFEASHTSQSEWTNLIAYMKEHGFSYKRIK